MWQDFLLFKAEFYCIIYYIFFIYLLVGRHLDHVYFLDIVNKIVMNTEVQILLQKPVSNSFTYPEVWLLDHMVALFVCLFLPVLRNLHTVFYNGCTIIFLPTVYKDSNFSTPLPTLLFSVLIFCFLFVHNGRLMGLQRVGHDLATKTKTIANKRYK